MKVGPAPAVPFGGGPAGVVELPKSDVVGLLVGVVVCAWPAEELAPRLPNIFPPVLAPPPKRLGFCCPEEDASEGLLGVEKPENPTDGAELVTA